MKKCLYCGEILFLRKDKVKINPKRKYCNEKCRCRDITLKNYHLKYKKDLEFIKRSRSNKRKKYFKEWYLKNKKKHNKIY